MKKRMIGFFALLATFLSTVSLADTATDPYRDTYPMGPLYCANLPPNPKDDFGRYVDFVGPKSIDLSQSGYACVTEAEGLTCWRENTSYCKLPNGYDKLPNGNGLSSVRLEWQHKLKGVITVATDRYHYCALTKTSVHCWGSNSEGQLDVPSLTNPRALVTRDTTSCALDDDVYPPQDFPMNVVLNDAYVSYRPAVGKEPADHIGNSDHVHPPTMGMRPGPPERKELNTFVVSNAFQRAQDKCGLEINAFDMAFLFQSIDTWRGSPKTSIPTEVSSFGYKFFSTVFWPSKPRFHNTTEEGRNNPLFQKVLCASNLLRFCS